MDPDDKIGRGIRFGCGFVFGLFVFGLGLLWFISEHLGMYVAAVLFASLAFGLGALRFGDAFWRWFSRWGKWFV